MASLPHRIPPPGRKYKEETTTTNKESYLIDIDDLQKAIDHLLSLVPIGKTKVKIQMREQAEKTASMARATISCMRNDYIITEL